MSIFTTGPKPPSSTQSPPPKTNFIFKQLTPDKVHETITILNNAFVDSNPVWVKLKVKRDEGWKIMESRVKRCENSGLSMMMVVPETGEMAMVGICLDLVDHLDGPKGVLLYDWQKPIANAAREMEIDYFRSLNPKRGEYIYGDAATLSPKFIHQHLNYLFWSTGFEYFKKLGYKAIFGRAANPISSSTLVKFGGKIVSEKMIKF